MFAALSRSHIARRAGLVNWSRKQSCFDAIVSDLHMPALHGAGLWREVRRTHPALARRMLFVTGDTLSPTARQFLDEARCDRLHKPFDEAELLARVATLLQG